MKIYTANDLFKAKLAEDLLKQNGIESHIASKPDSVFPPIGEAELYIMAEKADDAIRVLQENEFDLL